MKNISLLKENLDDTFQTFSTNLPCFFDLLLMKNSSPQLGREARKLFLKLITFFLCLFFHSQVPRHSFSGNCFPSQLVIRGEAYFAPERWRTTSSKSFWDGNLWSPGRSFFVLVCVCLGGGKTFEEDLRRVLYLVHLLEGN